VDAGATVSIRVIVACPCGCDLTGDTVSIRNQAGEELAKEELAEAEGGEWVFETPEIVVDAPQVPGTHVFTAVLAALEDDDGLSHDAVTTEFSVSVKPHTAFLNAWGMPSAISAGEKFSLKVSMKCSSSCKLAGRQLEIVDEQGLNVGTVTLREDTWPGTTALYYGELETDAPSHPGDRKWSVSIAAVDTGLPHASASFRFPIRVVTSPDYEVAIEAVDSDKQTPIKGLHVLMHPYRAATDENGIARIKVAKGTYKLHVSGFNYIAHQAVMNVDCEEMVRVELNVQPVDEEANWH
jgi:hypothetical protein